MMCIEVIHMANRIRSLREEINMTQIRLSTELEVSQETISAYETGRHNPSYALLVRMSNLFHASMDYIMGLSDVRKPLAEMALTDEERAAVNLFSRLNETERALAMTYMQGMYDAAQAQSKKAALKL